MIVRPLYIAGRFLSRLPFPDPGPATAAETGRSVVWYPFVGLLMGLVVALPAALLSNLPTAPAAALLLVLWVWSSGALHLDGLADTADGWIGGLGSRARTLEIMKDPRCGPAGVTAIALLLIAKWAGLQILLEQHLIWPVALLPMLGRAQIVLLLLTTPYARPGGMASDQFNALPHRAAWMAVAASAMLALSISLPVGFWLLTLAGLVFMLLRWNMLHRIGGFTGDSAGALAEISEAALLLFLALAGTAAIP